MDENSREGLPRAVRGGTSLPAAENSREGLPRAVRGGTWLDEPASRPAAENFFASRARPICRGVFSADLPRRDPKLDDRASLPAAENSREDVAPARVRGGKSAGRGEVPSLLGGPSAAG